MSIISTTYARGFNEALPHAVISTQATTGTGNVIVRLWDHFTCSGVIKAEARLSVTQTEALIESLTVSLDEAKRLLDEDIAAITIVNSISE